MRLSEGRRSIKVWVAARRRRQDPPKESRPRVGRVLDRRPPSRSGISSDGIGPDFPSGVASDSLICDDAIRPAEPSPGRRSGG